MRHILITGASRGIGAATARLCGAQGWRVGVNYHSNEKAAGETAKAVRAAGGEAVLLQGDMGEEAEILRVFDAFGPLDGLVINAGILEPRMKLAEMSAARITRIMRVNVTGALLCAREGARRMRAGAIVIISSRAAALGGAHEYVDYAASKGAMDALTIGLAKELAPDVRVNAIRPGLIETDIHAVGGWPDRARALSGQVPLKRPGSAGEVAQGALWLLDDASSYVTGAFIDISGGR